MWCLKSLFKKLEPQGPNNDGELGQVARSEINLNLEMFECCAGVFVALWKQEAAKMILRRACDKTFDSRCLVS
ncbi:hypothetical protein WICPIJ_003010 [Wickerhamomyces pijperi]|uniref:Uncharacterized protein n=1 Tax=Wickerhamomyces pijperi TaxID=599730 RepID=A0A9P8QAE2_WICPI|nr:hypothetical protein WICPIJ_003010 [Wickerhamomyces pijperi]